MPLSVLCVAAVPRKESARLRIGLCLRQLPVSFSRFSISICFCAELHKAIAHIKCFVWDSFQRTLFRRGHSAGT